MNDAQVNVAWARDADIVRELIAAGGVNTDGGTG
jgi:hypothetical protein